MKLQITVEIKSFNMNCVDDWSKRNYAFSLKDPKICP